MAREFFVTLHIHEPFFVYLNSKSLEFYKINPKSSNFSKNTSKIPWTKSLPHSLSSSHLPSPLSTHHSTPPNSQTLTLSTAVQSKENQLSLSLDALLLLLRWPCADNKRSLMTSSMDYSNTMKLRENTRLFKMHQTDGSRTVRCGSETSIRML